MLDVLVVGAGQSGLATCWALRGTPLRVEVVDGAGRVGESWRRRWDSLALFSPRRASALPGLALPGDPEGYPTKDELADYLEAYARWVGAPVRLRAPVRRLSRADGIFRAELGGGDVLQARAVAIATGAFQEPVVPAFAAALSPDVLQLTPATYRNPRQLPAGRVLVAGDGATGRQIALELAATHEVWLATGRRRIALSQRMLGRDATWWAQRLGLAGATRESLRGRLLRRYEPFPGAQLRHASLRRSGVTVAARVRGADGRRVVFSDGTSIHVDAVVWAVGYRDRTDWVDIPAAKDARGGFVERRGVSPVRGLFFVGREWQSTRASALLAGVARDAAYVAARIRELVEERGGVPFVPGGERAGAGKAGAGPAGAGRAAWTAP